MGKYTGIECTVCSEKFAEDDDIVVCPECGAPHHRSCYEELGHCAYEQKHAEGEDWKRPEPEVKAESLVNQCEACKAINTPDAIFCEMCGAPLKHPAQKNDQGAAQNGIPRYPNMGAQQGGQQIPPFAVNIGMNPFLLPYGGVNPDEEIDGVKAKDIATFVGQSASYYLPVFKNMANGRFGGFNWSAFFFNALYFFSRGLTWLAVLLGIFYIIAMVVPDFIYEIELLRANPNFVEIVMQALANGKNYTEMLATPAGQDTMITVSNIFTYAYWFSCILWGVFANKIYKNYVIKTIKELKQRYGDTVEYQDALTKKGGFKSMRVTVIAVVFFSVLVFAQMTIMLLMQMPV